MVNFHELGFWEVTRSLCLFQIFRAALNPMSAASLLGIQYSKETCVQGHKLENED